MVTCPWVVEELIEVLLALRTLVHPVLPLATPATEGRDCILSHSLPVIPTVIDAVVVGT
jgi:hypothetical protein